MQAPLIPITVMFILGIIIGNFFQIPNRCLMIALSISLIFLLFRTIREIRWFALFSLYVSFIFLGILSFNDYHDSTLHPFHIANLDYHGTIGLEGIVCDNPNRTPEKTDVIVEASRVVQNGVSIPVNGKALLSINGTMNIPAYGELIRAKVKLKAPHNFNNPGRFDYERFLRLKGIFIRGYVDDPSKITKIRGRRGNILLTWISSFRDNLRTLIRDNTAPPEAAILMAMVLGEQNEIPKDILNKFNRTGTTHILAISGFNIGIVFLITLVILQGILKSSEYLLLHFNVNKAATILTSLPVILYAYIAGMGMSVVRAAVMILVLVVAVIAEKERTLPNTLALAALFMLALYPPALFDVSFQLSFAAVVSILFIVPRFTDAIRTTDPIEKLHKPGVIRRALRLFYLFLLVTVAATIGTVPLTTYYFNTLSLMVIVANIFLIPLMGYAVTALCIAIILFAPMSGTVGIFIIKVTALIIRLSVVIVDKLASLPYASIYVATPTLLELAIYTLMVIGIVLSLDMLIHREKVKSRIKLGLLISSVLIPVVFFVADSVHIYIRNHYSDRLSVTFIDVGQGNSALVRLPGGKKILIDGGGFFDDRFDIGRNVLAPFLWHEKITKIDLVVLTHPHPDHLNGLLFIMNNFEVDEVLSNGMETTDEAYTDFNKIIAERRINHHIIDARARIMIGPVTLKILNPLSLDAVHDKDFSDQLLNDGSLIIQVIFNHVSFLFPGDISSTIEEKLIERKGNVLSDVLLAPHHGSRSSNTLSFLKKVRPKIVVFSCGKDNMFHLPDADVVTRYRSLGVEIWRTDQSGAITIESDGERITKKTGFIGLEKPS